MNRFNINRLIHKCGKSLIVVLNIVISLFTLLIIFNAGRMYERDKNEQLLNTCREYKASYEELKEKYTDMVNNGFRIPVREDGSRIIITERAEDYIKNK